MIKSCFSSEELIFIDSIVAVILAALVSVDSVSDVVIVDISTRAESLSNRYVNMFLKSQ